MTGDAAAVTIVAPDEGRAFWIVGEHHNYVLTGEQTNGAFTLVLHTVPPHVGPPPHIHHREDETFFVLEGEITIISDGGTTRAVAGTSVYTPKGTLHSFRNDGVSPARVLGLYTPAGIETYFEEVGQATSATVGTPPPVTQEDIERLLAAAPRYGLEIMVPAQPEGHHAS